MNPQTPFLGLLNAVNLSFKDKSVEQDYLSYYRNYIVAHVRVAMLVSIVLYVGFLFLDSFLFPEFEELFFQIRIYIVLPICFVGIVYTYLSTSLKYLLEVVSIATLVGAYGIIAMLYFGGQEVNMRYYVGLMLVFIFNYDFLKLRFVTASFNGIVILIGYVFVAILIDANPEILMPSLFFLISANIMGMVAAYYFEYLSRKYFYSKLLLEREKKKTAASNLYLEEQVLERTSNLQQVNTELVLAKEFAEESEHLKSVFLATMSHELRTPLNAIIGFSDIINSGENDEAENIAYAEIINRSGQHLLSLVDSLFDITLIDSGQVKLKMGEYRLLELMTNVNSIMLQERIKLEKENIDLKLEITNIEPDFKIHTDGNKIKQALINLLKNALKFTESGEVKFWCEEIMTNNKPYLKFYVQDSGIGIPSEKIDLIFDVFRQVDDTHSRKYGGVGIGLTVVRKLVDMLDGEVGVDSVEGKGSTFYFTVGNYLKEDLNFSLVAATESPESLEPLDAKILIVEDDDASYYLLELLLERKGATVTWVQNGELAIEILANGNTFDLILMDLNMPVLNGYEATIRIKELYPNQVIIAQTAYAVTGDKEKALAVGCDAYISKPIGEKELIALITEYL